MDNTSSYWNSRHNPEEKRKRPKPLTPEERLLFTPSNAIPSVQQQTILSTATQANENPVPREQTTVRQQPAVPPRSQPPNVGWIKCDVFRELLCDQCVDCCSVWDAVCSVKPGSTTPEEIWIRCEHYNSHKIVLHCLIWEVEGGSAITVEKDIQSCGSVCGGRYSCTWNS
jgi:hypothetical protein